MSKYLIMRVEKLKSKAAIRGMSSHNFRAIETPNADKSRTAKNEHKAAQSVSECMQRYDDLKPDKIRKNAVHALDYMITTSSDASDRDKQIAIEESIAWIEEKHGKENVLLCSVHRDETTPHAHVLVMPLKDGKLNAKHFVGGSKHRLSELQDELHERVSAKTELNRGVRGSRASHQSIKQWRAGIQRRLSEPLKGASKADLLKSAAITRKDALSPQKATERVSGAINTAIKAVKDHQFQNGLLLEQNQKLKTEKDLLQKNVAKQDQLLAPIRRAAEGDIAQIDDLVTKLQNRRAKSVKSAHDAKIARIQELKSKIGMDDGNRPRTGSEKRELPRGGFETESYRLQRGERPQRGFRSDRDADRANNTLNGRAEAAKHPKPASRGPGL